MWPARHKGSAAVVASDTHVAFVLATCFLHVVSIDTQEAPADVITAAGGDDDAEAEGMEDAAGS